MQLSQQTSLLTGMYHHRCLIQSVRVEEMDGTDAHRNRPLCGRRLAGILEDTSKHLDQLVSITPD